MSDLKNWQDVYELPLRIMNHSSWVRDAKDHFVFQFKFYESFLQLNILAVINGLEKPTRQHNFVHENGVISENGVEFILIRGWGFLTGTGGLNLPPEDAANIQDTFADFILSKLNQTP